MRFLLILTFLFLPLFGDEFLDRSKEAWGISQNDPAYSHLRHLPQKIEATAALARKLHRQGDSMSKALNKAKKAVASQKQDYRDRLKIENYSNLKKLVIDPLEITFFSKRF